MHDLGTDSLERKARPETVHKKKKYRSVRLRKKKSKNLRKKEGRREIKENRTHFPREKAPPGTDAANPYFELPAREFPKHGGEAAGGSERATGRVKRGELCPGRKGGCRRPVR